MLNIIICVVLLYFIIYYSIPPDFQVSMIYSVNVFIITLRLYFAGLSSLKYARDVIDHFAVSAPLVSSLSGALQALQDDDVIKDALGEEFVRWFVTSKTMIII